MQDDLNKEDLLKLLELSYQDEAVHIQIEQKTLSLSTTLITLILGGLLAAQNAGKISDPVLGGILILGGAIIALFSILGVKAFRSNYGRHIEAIVVRAKIEDQLDMGDEKYYGKLYWKEEALILPRYLEGRTKEESSSEFVERRGKMPFSTVVTYVFASLATVGGIIIIYGISKVLT